MTPGFYDLEFSPDDSLGGRAVKKFASWLCQPFFTLQKYSGDLSAYKTGSHPVHTLCQIRSHAAKKERDMQQAVCNLQDSDPGVCFHVAQVWSITVADGTSILLRHQVAFITDNLRPSYHMCTDIFTWTSWQVYLNCSTTARPTEISANTFKNALTCILWRCGLLATPRRRLPDLVCKSRCHMFSAIVLMQTGVCI